MVASSVDPMLKFVYYFFKFVILHSLFNLGFNYVLNSLNVLKVDHCMLPINTFEYFEYFEKDYLFGATPVNSDFI